MDAYSMGRSLGMLVGVGIGVLLAIIALRMMNKDKKVRTEYDEMQQVARGKGFRIAFYTAMITEAVLCIADMGNNLPAEPVVLHFIPIFLGVTVLSVYCIMKDAFIGLNTRLRFYIILCVFISLINLAVAAAAWKGGDMVVNGMLQAPFVNFLCGLMFVIIGLTGLIKLLKDRRETA